MAEKKGTVALRNFYMEAKADGRAGMVTGPEGALGGMTLRVAQRSGGTVVDALEVWCTVRADGALMTRISVPGHVAIEYITQR